MAHMMTRMTRWLAGSQFVKTLSSFPAIAMILRTTQ